MAVVQKKINTLWWGGMVCYCINMLHQYPAIGCHLMFQSIVHNPAMTSVAHPSTSPKYPKIKMVIVLKWAQVLQKWIWKNNPPEWSLRAQKLELCNTLFARTRRSVLIRWSRQSFSWLTSSARNVEWSALLLCRALAGALSDWSSSTRSITDSDSGMIPEGHEDRSQWN
jgi:hypothetical protein